jgi:hypothetical protein
MKKFVIGVFCASVCYNTAAGFDWHEFVAKDNSWKVVQALGLFAGSQILSYAGYSLFSSINFKLSKGDWKMIQGTGLFLGACVWNRVVSSLFGMSTNGLCQWISGVCKNWPWLMPAMVWAPLLYPLTTKNLSWDGFFEPWNPWEVEDGR